MFTECTIMEIINDLKLNSLKKIILGERGSLVFNGMSFKENTLSFVIPYICPICSKVKTSSL